MARVRIRARVVRIRARVVRARVGVRGEGEG